MRIRTLIIATIAATTLTVSTLTVIGLSASFKLEELSSIEARAQAAAREVSTLLVLTHEYALHSEPRAAYQWNKHFDTLLQIIGTGGGKTVPLADETLEQTRSLGELFTHLVASSAEATGPKKQQRTEILLGQLLSNTQAISDRFHELSLETAARRETAGKTFHYAGFAIPLFSLIALTFISALLITRILRPLEKMRKAVDAVSQGNLTVRSNTGTVDEFGELSRAFDTMALDLVTQLRQEITERRLIEDNLQRLVNERTASLNAIVDTAADGIITTDEAGSILSVNQATEQLFGYKAHEVIGHNVSMLMPLPYQSTHGGHMRKYLATGHSNIIGRGREVEGRHKDGHPFPIYIAISEVRLANERRFTGIMRDITEQKQTELALTTARDEAEHANQAKSEFLSSMSHELRTPMNAILGFSQLMDYDDTLPTAHRDSVREILKAGYHLLSLINEVLDLAKIESGHIDLSLEEVAIYPLINECLTLLAPMAVSRDIRISNSSLARATVRADRTRLKQALLNLLTNAIKYNRDGGSIKLDVQPRDENLLRILVTDTGPGIPASRLAELFQPFSRLDAESRGIEGTGIGLTITRTIVEMMGGTVDVESEVGKGSIFWIELPLESLSAAERELPTTDSVPPILRAGDQQRTVLYIEDNPSNLRLVTQIMGQRKHLHLLTAHTPELGIELAQAHSPDLILLDINMPGMDGYQVLELFKGDASLNSTPVVAVTANAMSRDIERGIKAGFVEYLTKPIDVNKFHAMLDKLLVADKVA